MQKEEVDEISEAFSEAWRENFGQEMFYIPFLAEESGGDSFYNESRNKKYDEENMKPFYGTLKEQDVEETGTLYGKEEKVVYLVKFVTKELVDQGIEQVNSSDKIRVYLSETDYRDYNITSRKKTVQFNQWKIFTELEVVYDE